MFVVYSKTDIVADRFKAVEIIDIVKIIKIKFDVVIVIDMFIFDRIVVDFDIVAVVVFPFLVGLPFLVALVEDMEFFDFLCVHRLGLVESFLRVIVRLILLGSTSANEISAIVGIVSTVFAMRAPFGGTLVALLARNRSVWIVSALLSCESGAIDGLASDLEELDELLCSFGFSWLIVVYRSLVSSLVL